MGINNTDGKMTNIDINSMPDVTKHSRKNIILICQNMYDGVGDFEHFRTHAKDLAVLRSKGYRIVGCLEIHQVKQVESNVLRESDKLMNSRA